MFRIKICGVRTPADVEAVVAAGADAIGLNFYRDSPRRVSPVTARELAAVARDASRLHKRPISVVGVFVDAGPHEIDQAVATVPLDMVQLHGDEAPPELVQLAPVEIVKAFRADADDRRLDEVRSYVDICGELGVPLTAVLLDTASPGLWGGSGRVGDWTALAAALSTPLKLPVILAGGLTPSNVVQAITTVRPYGVDTASGVEGSGRVKSPERIREFVRAARAALGHEGGP